MFTELKAMNIDGKTVLVPHMKVCTADRIVDGYQILSESGYRNAARFAEMHTFEVLSPVELGKLYPANKFEISQQGDRELWKLKENPACREIKFRAWETNLKVMLEGVTVYGGAKEIGLPFHEDLNDMLLAKGYDTALYELPTNWALGEDWYFILSDFELIEYTGLKDKNGKEIYEGDIVVSESGKIGVIEFDMGLFGINWDYGTDNKTMLGVWSSNVNLRRMYDGYHELIEVIGTIYTNPDLLVKEAKS